MSNDPWAAASAATSPAPASYSDLAEQESSAFADAYAPEGSGSQLFGQDSGPSLPSLFNLKHAPGTEFKGLILGPPRDVQATSFPQQPGDPRYPLFWGKNAAGKPAPVTDERLAVPDPKTGKIRPVMDTVIELQIEGRFTPDERAYLVSRGRDEDFEDDGKRVWQISGSKNPKGHRAGQPTNAMRAMLDAIAASARELGITKNEDLEGKYLTVRRIDRVQPGISTSPWTYIARITKD